MTRADEMRREEPNNNEPKIAKPEYSSPQIFELGTLDAIKLEWHGVDSDGSGGYYQRRQG